MRTSPTPRWTIRTGGQWGKTQVDEPDYPGEYLAADYIDRLTRV